MVAAVRGSTDSWHPMTVLFVAEQTSATSPSLASYVKAIAKRNWGHSGRPVIEFAQAIPEDIDKTREAIDRSTKPWTAAIIAVSGDVASAASKSSNKTPVVFFSYIDPVSMGIARSSQRPGLRSTGVSMADVLDDKRLDLLIEAYPTIRRIGVLADQSWARAGGGAERIRNAARIKGREVRLVTEESPEAMVAAIRRGQAEGVDAWYFPITYPANQGEEQIIDELRRLAVPAIFAHGLAVDKGAPMSYAQSYGQDSSAVWNTLAELTWRVLQGEDPAGIPIERPRRFVLSIRTGSETNLPPIDPAIVRRADRIY